MIGGIHVQKLKIHNNIGSSEITDVLQLSEPIVLIPIKKVAPRKRLFSLK